MERLNLFIASGIAVFAVIMLLLLMGQSTAAATAEASGSSFGTLFFAAGLFLVIFGPVMGFVSLNSGNLFGAIMWWMLGTTLGVGLLMSGTA